MLVNPATPNLTDYVSFLYGVVGIPPANLLSVVSLVTADAGTGSLTDGNQNWKANQWAGYTITDVTQGELAAVASNDQFTAVFVVPMATEPVPGDVYVIAPQIMLTTLAIAQEIVNETLARVSPSMYTLAVYNLAADRLINFARDVPNQTYFRDVRKDFRVSDPIMGVVAGGHNESTSMQYLNPEQMKLLTLGQLQNMKTPWGREYLSIAQSYGQTIWGLS